MTKVIIFNGPPRSGKDAVTKFLELKYSEIFFDMKIAYSLKTGCHKLLGMTNIDPERFNDIKDEERIEFFGSTPREFYIRVAENLIKPMYGQETFGHIWLRRYKEFIQSMEIPIVTISDCGFIEELGPLFKEFGPSEMILIRIHREGYDYSKDSRSYVRVANSEFRQYDVDNPNGDIDLFFSRVDFILNQNGVFAEAYS